MLCRERGGRSPRGGGLFQAGIRKAQQTCVPSHSILFKMNSDWHKNLTAYAKWALSTLGWFAAQVVC